MYTLIKSLLSQPTSPEVENLIERALTSSLMPEEEAIFHSLKESLPSGVLPSEDYLLQQFPDAKIYLETTSKLSLSDCKVHLQSVLQSRQRHNVSQTLMRIASEADKLGVTKDHLSQIRDLRSKDEDVKCTCSVPDCSCSVPDQMTCAKRIYLERAKRPSGLYTYINSIDDAIGGLSEGTLNTIIGFTGSFKCVSGETRVPTSHGLIKMKEVYEKYGRELSNEVLSEDGPQRVVHVHHDGVKESFIIHTSDGLSVESSPVHRFRVLTEDGEYVWREAKDLMEGTVLVGTMQRSPGPLFSYGPSASQQEDLYYALGIANSIGTVSQDQIEFDIELPTFDELDLSKKLTNAFGSDALEIDILPNDYDSVHVTIMSPSLAKELVVAGINCPKDRTVMERVFQLSQDEILSYLAGVFDISPWFCVLGSVSRKYVEGIAQLLLYVGILPEVTTDNVFGNDIYNVTVLFERLFVARARVQCPRDYYSLDDAVPLYNLIPRVRKAFRGFSGAKITTVELAKLSKDQPQILEDQVLKDFITKKFFTVKVTKIERSTADMYDLTVENSHTYVVNGLITHNTTFGVNIAYNNAVKMGYNICFCSFEVPREDIWFNLISRHSADIKFERYSFVGHERIRRCELTEDEQDFLWNEVVPDLEASKGKIIILQSSDFKSKDPNDLLQKLEEVDDYVKQKTGTPIDAFIWDHIQMFKFSTGVAKGSTEGSVMNAYTNQFMNWALDFRGRKTIQVMLAQVNRTGWLKAVKRGGLYDLTAIAEVNEVERASSRILSIFTDDNLKASKECKVQLLKSRFGKPVPDPVSVFVDPECYIFAEDVQGFSSMPSTNDMDSLFADGF
jgi:replicative DNA helicase